MTNRASSEVNLSHRVAAMVLEVWGSACGTGQSTPHLDSTMVLSVSCCLLSIGVCFWLALNLVAMVSKTSSVDGRQKGLVVEWSLGSVRHRRVVGLRSVQHMAGGR